MLAIEITESNNANGLSACSRPIPEPEDYQVRIKVHAAGINRPDVMQRQGLYPPPSGASDIPGLEVAGIVDKTGRNVMHLKQGDPVCALVTGGGYAEYCLASERLCLPVPTGFSYVQAAALPETYFTVWSNLFDRAHLLPGETILVHGGSSGIGTTAIQLAKAFAISVFVTAGSEAKCDFCLQLGADAAINYKHEDFVATIAELTDFKGVNVVLDMIGGDYFPRNLKCLATDGRLVQIAIQHGAKSEVNLWSIMQKRLTLTGSTLRNRDDCFKAAIAIQLKQKVWPLLENGTIKPAIHTTFPLNQAATAHQLLESSQHMGKIMLTVPS
jgi:putative PIG3 family NAD(P)H quinone oxidoreductase